MTRNFTEIARFAVAGCRWRCVRVLTGGAFVQAYTDGLVAGPDDLGWPA